MENTKKKKGLGDRVEDFFKATKIDKVVELFTDGKDCGCDKRKLFLNNLFKGKEQPRCMTENEYNDWKQFKFSLSNTLSHNDVLYVAKTYSDIFNRQYVKPCTSCRPTILISYIDKINKVYDTYRQD